MVKKIIAVLLAVTISLLGAIKPAYAESLSLLAEISFISNQTSFFEQSTKFIGDKTQQFVNEMGNQAIAATAYVTVCYAADTLATSVFPPAGFIAPACPFIAEGIVTTEAAVTTGIAAMGGTTVAKKVVQLMAH